jgi:hypothetical protein
MPGDLEKFAQTVYPAADIAVIEAFAKGLAKERASFFWEILGGGADENQDHLPSSSV